jgi:hypothetical protein
VFASIVVREHIIYCSHLFASTTGEENLKTIVRSTVGVVRETLVDLADDPVKLGRLHEE